MLIFYAPIFVGKDAPPIFGIKGAENETEVIKMKIKNMERMGNGYLITIIPEQK